MSTRPMNKNKKIALSIEMLLLCGASLANNTPVVDWHGFYVGGFLGGAASNRTTISEPLRLDNNTFWFRPFHNSFRYNNRSSFMGGATFGYNWQPHNTPYLLGFEAEYGSLKNHGSSMDPNQIPYAVQPGNNIYNSSINSTTIGNAYTLLGGRIGYVHNRWLLFVKSGAVFTKISSQYHSTKTDSTSSTGIAFLNISGTKNITGYGVGGGLEYALPFKGFSNISAKLEYLYFGLDKTVLTYGHCSCDFLWRTSERLRGINTAKFGLNYRI